MKSFDKISIAIIGLGYVGLPLAVEFGKKYNSLGFDINPKRILELKSDEDKTLELSAKEIKSASKLKFSSNQDDLKDANIYIVTVPTPIDQNKQPDLSFLEQASEMVGKVISKGDIVIYESTVYPGATEEDCIPIIEKSSGLIFNKDFFAGYSPERINPGDKNHKVTEILKVTSGSTPEASNFIDELYSSIIPAGTHKVSSIRVAEASKIIENTQRDVNIALINELAIIFDKMEIDTQEVLIAAGTKWNFLKFWPGLVGGHCIGVDPYYITQKAQSIGYFPEIILAGRRINDGMSYFVASNLIKHMIKNNITIEGSKVLIMGLAFKENCADIRNTKVVDLISELKDFNEKISIDVIDPMCSHEEAKKEYGINLTTEYKKQTYDAIILAVGHDEFKKMGLDKIRGLAKKNHVMYDLKYIFSKDDVNIRL